MVDTQQVKNSRVSSGLWIAAIIVLLRGISAGAEGTLELKLPASKPVSLNLPDFDVGLLGGNNSAKQRPKSCFKSDGSSERSIDQQLQLRHNDNGHRIDNLNSFACY